MEDGYILALALRDYLKDSTRLAQSMNGDLKRDRWILEHHIKFYQWFRLPRAQKVQETTREASLIYELQTPEFAGKSFDECLPTFAKVMKGRMDWIWYEDLEQSYELARTLYPKPAEHISLLM